MITASEALLAAKKSQIDVIETNIKSATDRGLYEVRINGEISEENKTLLVRNGYKMTAQFTMSGNEYIINWDEKPELKVLKAIPKKRSKKNA